MSSIQAGLFPDKVLLVIQGCVYIAALGVAHVLIIKPALRLTVERHRRTIGKKEKANAVSAEARSAEEQWNAALRSATDEARRLRAAEVARGQGEAQKILQAAGDLNRSRLAEARQSVEATLQEERERLPALVDEVAQTIFTKLGVAGAVLMSALSLLNSGEARASGGEGGLTLDNFVWPYFQFILFAVVIYFAGKRVFPNLLATRREKLRGELAEAQEALKLAEEKALLLSTKLATMEQELAELRTRYQTEGVRECEVIVAEAKRLAEQMQSDSERVVSETLAKGREKLRRELLDLALKTVEERLTPEKLAALDGRFRSEALDSIKNLAVD